MKISIIIPTFNEESVIHETLQDLFSQHPDEVIVVDGGSRDQTVALAREWTQVHTSEKGRAAQMNAGAKLATGDVLLFLHADTKLPMGGLKQIRQAIECGAAAGRFRMRFDDAKLSLKFFQAYTRFAFFSYGDQGYFVTRKMFEKLDGYRYDVPFEDVDFYKRLSQVTHPVILKSAVTTSARRFLKVGCLRQKWINLFLVGLYYAGFNVLKLKEKHYSDVR